MNIHRRLVALVALGMLLIMTITVFSLLNTTTALSLSTKDVGNIFSAFQRVWTIEKNTTNMSLSVHNFLETGNEKYRTSYETSLKLVRETLNDVAGATYYPEEMKILESLSTDIDALGKKADYIFSFKTSSGEKFVLADNITADLDSLIEWMEKDIERYREAITIRMGDISLNLQENKRMVNLLFLINLISSVTFLLAFGIYLHRKVSAPLSDLWKGTEEISRGNLDHRIEGHGARDITLLGERFNEMAQKLKQSYTELERKLSDRTNELAALDAVALTLSESRTLKDLLNKSLSQIFNSLENLEPRGGVFLCDPDGETLRLTVHRGLSPDFVRSEETIKMGECLCGAAAQSGEMLYSQLGCEDTRHTRDKGGDAHAHIIIPIKSRGIVLGVIFLYPTKDFKMKPSDVQLLDAVGAQLGLAVENFRFYAEVKESSEKYWDLFENSRDIFFTMDTSGTLTSANRAAEKFTGYPKVELIGMNVMDFLTVPKERETARRILAGEDVFERQVIDFEAVRRNNSHAFLQVSSRKLFKNQVLSGFQVSARDVTEQKGLREMLLKAERLGAIGQVGIAVRHEINNPLTTVIGNVELLIERYEDKDKELTARLESILNNSLRIAEIVKRLQDIKQDKVVEYLKGVKMTDLK